MGIYAKKTYYNRSNKCMYQAKNDPFIPLRTDMT